MKRNNIFLTPLKSFDTFLKTKTLRTSGQEKDLIAESARPECHVVVYRRVTSGTINILFILLFYSVAHATPTFETAQHYQKAEQFDDAISCYKEILQNEPRDINALFNLGCCYLALGLYQQAISSFDAALAIQPYALPALYNKAFTYKTAGDIDTAIKLYKDIIALDPTYEPAQLGLGFAYITQGNFDLGWDQHERYLKKSGKNADKLRKLIEEDTIAHKKILLRPEGGLGDTLHFVRYAERLKQMGAHVIVACQTPLIPILSRCLYIDQLITCGKHIPEHDADATLMSLPAVFYDDEKSAPDKMPYLYADPQLVEYWHDQLAADTNFKVGICWQAEVKNDIPSKLPIARRGVPLCSFEPLASLKGISFYSLQKYDGVDQIATTNLPLHVFDNLDEQTGPFMDSAALIKNLDLVITVDTAVAHLAGALEAQVWLLHPYATADWRWICHRTDSYWYPTMRIFKQKKPFDYDGVIKEVFDALQELIRK